MLCSFDNANEINFKTSLFIVFPRFIFLFYFMGTYINFTISKLRFEYFFNFVQFDRLVSIFLDRNHFLG